MAFHTVLMIVLMVFWFFWTKLFTALNTVETTVLMALATVLTTFLMVFHTLETTSLICGITLETLSLIAWNALTAKSLMASRIGSTTFFTALKALFTMFRNFSECL